MGRKNHQRAMDSLQASLEAEVRAKTEALRIKKKLESDINELEIALDHANKANSEAHKSIKRYQAQLRDVDCMYEEEARQRREIAEKAGLADRRANALQSEVDEARSLLDSAIHTMHAELDDMLHQAKNSEEKGKKAMIDAARLADELRAEQEHANAQEKAKRTLETQMIELEQRLNEANDMAAKFGRNAMAKLENRIRELEIELGSCQSRTSDAYKAFQKADRHIKELQFQ